jgi:hypothetical protein
MGAQNKGKSDKGGFKGKRSARGASVAGEKARSRQNRGQDVGTSGPPARDRFKSTEESRKQSKAIADRVAKINKDFNKKTAFKTSSGFLKDKYGNIVRSKKQVERFNEQKKREKALRDMFASQIQAQEAKQVTPTFGGLKGILDKTRKRLGTGEFSIEKANQLKNINRALGDFDYTGMSIGNQLRAQAGDLAAGIPGLAKIGGALAGGPLGVAGLIASGGRGIAGLLADKLGIGEDDEDSKPTIADVSNERPGFLSGIASALRFGEGPGFTEDRGGGRQQPIIPPPTTGGFFGRVQAPIKKLPITTQPVTGRMLNQYLALAGFTPQEIQGMPETFRFLE